MKKKLLSIIVFVLMLSLSGCTIQVETETTTQATSTNATESPVDYSKIASEIYSNVYSEVKEELYEELRQELIDEFIDGTIDYDDLQSRIYKTVDIATSGNVAVYNLESDSNGELVETGLGSGVIYDVISDASKAGSYETTTLEKAYRYYVITNEHVVEGGEGFKVVFADGTYADAYLIGSDATNDIAVVYFDSDNEHSVMTLGDSDEAKVGEIVLACGNPKGETLFNSITMGVIGGKNRNLIESSGATNTINKYIQHDAAINAGNSGGGLYNLDGECIGINSVKYVSTSDSEIEGLNFAIPINLVKTVSKEIREYGQYDGTVTFGINVAPISSLTSAGRVKYNVPDEVTEGVIVISVTEDGSSYGIIEDYDIIIEADGVKVTASSDLATVLSNHRIGDTITLKVLRSGVETSLELTFKRKTTN